MTLRDHKSSKLHFITSIFFIFVLVSCNTNAEDKNSFSINGFKEIKFGLDANKLADMGVSCDIEPDSIIAISCQMSKSALENFTLFGQKTTLSVKIVSNKISLIRVSIDFPPDYLIEQFTSSLGPPKIYNYVSGSGYNINSYYWVSKEGNSIVVTKNLDSNQSFSTVKVFGRTYKMKKSSSVEYLNKEETTKFLKQVPPVADRKDF